MPHVHARTGRAGQGVDNVKNCNVLATPNLRCKQRELSRYADAIQAARDKLLISMARGCRGRPTLFYSNSRREPGRRAGAACYVSPSELAEQSFFNTAGRLIEPNSVLSCSNDGTVHRLALDAR
jgi:hypothetical protein